MGLSTLTWRSPCEFSIENVHYLTRQAPQQCLLPEAERSPATVILIHRGDHISCSYLEERIKSYVKDDDVFRSEFLRTIIFHGAKESDLTFDAPPIELMERWGILEWSFADESTTVPAGPYILDNNKLFQVWRVYDDFNQAFVLSTWPSIEKEKEGQYQNLRMAGGAPRSLGIAVPSRLYFERSEALPLNGLRVAIKDIFHLAGVQTSCCSRAYHDLYPEQEDTAASIKILVALGAQIVGKTHLSSFALKEEPTECVDYQAPFNPRADGYQTPAGSSSGSGAAIASYDWLDFALGTDTTGGGRRPALWNGCFGLRPSAGLLSAEGMVATMPDFDSPSFLSRDIETFMDVAKRWYNRPLKPLPKKRTLPPALLYPTDYLPIANTEQMRVIDSFVKDLAEHLGVEPQIVSIEDSWAKSSPVEEKNVELYMQNVIEHGFFYQAYHCFDTFRADYQRKFNQPPYMTEVNRWMWGIGRLLNKDQHEKAMEKFATFKEWFVQHILKIHEQNAVMVLPIETLEPRYRDTPPAIPSVPPSGINVLYLSPTLGAPEIIVPAGEIPFHSRISNQVEHLPVAVSILGAPDTDLELMEMIEKCLKRSGRPCRVLTGKSMFKDSGTPKSYRDCPKDLGL